MDWGLKSNMITTRRAGAVERGADQPLVFLHGIGGNAETWRYQLDIFRERYRAIAFDLPGYGHAPPLAETNFPALAEWLHGSLRALEIEQPILVGHSFGGMIVQEYLATYPGQTKAVVLYGTSPAFGRKDGDWQQKFVRARLQPLDDGKKMVDLAPQIVAGLVGSGAKPEGIALAQAGVAATTEEAFRRSIHCLVDFDQRANLSRIDIPCLLLVGAEDTNAPAAMMEKMASKIHGASYRCLSGLGHLAHLEDAEIFNRALVEFLRGLQQVRP